MTRHYQDSTSIPPEEIRALFWSRDQQNELETLRQSLRDTTDALRVEQVKFRESQYGLRLTNMALQQAQSEIDRLKGHIEDLQARLRPFVAPRGRDEKGHYLRPDV